MKGFSAYDSNEPILVEKAVSVSPGIPIAHLYHLLSWLRQIELLVIKEAIRNLQINGFAFSVVKLFDREVATVNLQIIN